MPEELAQPPVRAEAEAAPAGVRVATGLVLPLELLGRHQIAAFAATVVDFACMIALVRAASMDPVKATAIGAGLGAITSFLLGRHWCFGATDGNPWGQAARYAAVSAISLGLNTLGELLLFRLLGVQYVVARGITSLLVGVGWNFPAHWRFVFRVSPKASR